MFAVISIYQLEYMLDQGQMLLLVDLRFEAEFSLGHLYGAVNIPYESLEEREEELYLGLPVLFYCEHGGKSMQAAREYGNKGLQTASLGCGIQYYHGKYLVSGQNFIDRYTVNL